MDPFDSVRVWDTGTGELWTTLTRERHEPDWDVAFAPDGRVLAATGQTSNVELFDLGSTRWLRETVPSAGSADGLGVAIDPTSSWMATSATKGGVVVAGLDVTPLAGTGAAYRLPTCRSSSFAWGASLVVRCLDRGSVEVWLPSEKRRLRALGADSIRGIAAAASTDGRLLVQCQSVFQKVAPPKKTAPKKKPRYAHPYRPVTVACSVEDAFTGAQRARVELQGFPNLGKLHEVALNATGDRIAITTLPSATLWMWSLTDGKSVRLPRYYERVKQMVWSPDGHRLAASSQDKVVRIWSDSGQLLQELGGDR